MSGTRHRPRGTTYLPLALDVMTPSDLVAGVRPRRHDWGRWRRALLLAGATAAALAVLLATRAW
jgi:hypothetical protein